MSSSIPTNVRWYVVDIAGIFAVTAPRIAHVVKEIRTERVPPQTPTFCVAFIGHVHRAEPDIANASNIPTAMVHARRIGLTKGQHVMITSMNCMHERDYVCRTIRELQTEVLRVEVDCLVDVRCEDEDVRKPARFAHIGRFAQGRPCQARRRRRPRDFRFLVGRAFGATLISVRTLSKPKNQNPLLSNQGEDQPI